MRCITDNHAFITDLILSTTKTIQLNDHIHVGCLHSYNKFHQARVKFCGEIPIEEATDNDSVVVIDAFAYRQRHQEKGSIVYLKTGGYERTPDGQYCTRKIVGIIRGRQKLFVLTEPSNDKVKDVAPRMPVILSGLIAAVRKVKKCAHYATNPYQLGLFQS